MIPIEAHAECLEKEIARLQTELTTLRSQLVPWRDGGARGVEQPLFSYGSYIVRYKSSFDVLDVNDMYGSWKYIERYVPLSELPRGE
jgi:hypothetical protein